MAGVSVCLCTADLLSSSSDQRDRLQRRDSMKEISQSPKLWAPCTREVPLTYRSVT